MLLIVGSPRKQGTSQRFAESLSEISSEPCRIVNGYDYLEKVEELLEVITGENLIGFIMPLYVDSAPGPVIELLEKLSSHQELLSGKSIFSIGQCGFPDIRRMDPMHMVFQCFSERCNMLYKGNLSYGGGAIINGRPLKELGKRGQKFEMGFEKAIDNLLKGENIDKEAQDIIEFKFPKILKPALAFALNRKAKGECKRLGKDIYAKPYLK